jgi:hypothetical protein
MAQLRAMSPAWRNATLSQAIDDAGPTQPECRLRDIASEHALAVR